MKYTIFQLSFCLLLYAFLGWALSTAYHALKDRRFVNRGFLNLPFAISEGITAVILMLSLPTLERNPFWQLLLTFVVVYVIDALTERFLLNMSRRSGMTRTHSISTAVTMVFRTAEALTYWLLYLLVHPFVLAFLDWAPGILLTAASAVGIIAVALDFWGVVHALRHGGSPREDTSAQRLGQKLSDRIWTRLEKAYPGIQRLEPEQYKTLTFAGGLCFDKLVWVFFLSSFLGALIEMVYCRLVGGTWMSRSSLLYGPFSIVWGLGAVVLTVVLQRYAHRSDRFLFMMGFVVGGAYEYLCSVFTEVIFGTVFWDYSYMPLNIGGRTNVLFCIFWGILGVVWLRTVYPPMEKTIEKIPALWGKILTWVLVVFLLWDGGFTAMAMGRYGGRQNDRPPANIVEEIIDTRYDDGFMENRWPNMIVTE